MTILLCHEVRFAFLSSPTMPPIVFPFNRTRGWCLLLLCHNRLRRFPFLSCIRDWLDQLRQLKRAYCCVVAGVSYVSYEVHAQLSFSFKEVWFQWHRRNVVRLFHSLSCKKLMLLIANKLDRYCQNELIWIITIGTFCWITDANGYIIFFYVLIFIILCVESKRQELFLGFYKTIKY